MTKDIDWKNLGFSYIRTDYSFVAYNKDGVWQEGELVTDNKITISQASSSLHYGQQCFEGLKAYRNKDGEIQLFRPDLNALRLQESCERLLIPQISTEYFIAAVKKVVAANQDWVPPYGTGATLYIRPYIIGVGDNIGVSPAPEYLFGIFVIPVGPYFKGGLQPFKFLAVDYDRAAAAGTGAVKVGGNYAASLLPGKIAKNLGYADAVYLDPISHTKIEEVGAANILVITANNEIITPKSSSILNSITRRSVLEIAATRFGLTPLEQDILIADLNPYVEAFATGTAAVITPIGSITYQDKEHVFYSATEVGPITKKLYAELTGIQCGDIAAPEGWIYKI